MSEKLNDRDNCITLIQSLIINENIKQEELYPQWIACSDRMPEEGQEVICGWLEHGKIIAHAEIAIFGDIDEYYNGDCISVSQGWSNRDCDELNQYFDNNPTHWHPIPTL